MVWNFPWLELIVVDGFLYPRHPSLSLDGQDLELRKATPPSRRRGSWRWKADPAYVFKANKVTDFLLAFVKRELAVAAE
jgi:hypothetical protein